MQLESVRIQNFRSFEDQTVLFDEYTSLVGPNGAGKSTVLTALNVFFRNNVSSATNVQTLDTEDFHLQDITKPVVITLTFKNLSPEAQQEFRHYYRQGRLTISAKAVWDEKAQCAEVKQYGSRLVMKEFAEYFGADANGVKASELKVIYSGLRERFPSLPMENVKQRMSDALREYEEANEGECELLEDGNQFYGWSKGSNLLRKYLQWVYIPAVKDASTEQEESSRTALGQLLERTIRTKITFDESLSELKKELEKKYLDVLEKEQGALREIESSLENRLREWTTPATRVDLKWDYDPAKSVVVNQPFAKIRIGEGSFVGEIARLGHGMQRVFIVSILQELAYSMQDEGPTLLLGFEEPELYQHPPQSQHIASLLEKMAVDNKTNTQVIVTTHSPYFISSKTYENVRCVKKTDSGQRSVVSQLKLEAYDKHLSEALGERPQSIGSRLSSIEQVMQPSQKELFFTRVAVIVEGVEDVAFLTTWLQLTGRWDQFREHGCHFIVANGKNNISRPLAIAIGLGIPSFTFFDGDAIPKNESAKKSHLKSNLCVFRLAGMTCENPWPSETIWTDSVVMWHSNIGDVIREEIGGSVWKRAEEKARRNSGLIEGVKPKNNLLIAATLSQLFDDGAKCRTLDRLGEYVIAFAKGAGTAASNSAVFSR